MYNFTYDYSYGIDTPQETVFKDLGIFILDKAFQGYNGTIFAYGQTGSGKTHSIMGYEEDPGIVPRVSYSISTFHLFDILISPKLNYDLFERIRIAKDADDRRQFLVTVSYLELYNETIYDLLNGGKGEGTTAGLKGIQYSK